MRRLGQPGMPDAIRSTVESVGARPQRRRLRAVAAIFATAVMFGAASIRDVEAAVQGSALDTYVSALSLLDRHEIAALGLTLGILGFAVVTAILLVRTRQRLAGALASERDQAIASRAAIDRAHALLLSEPQVLVAWPPTADEPEIIGDPAPVTGVDRQRVLAFRAWLAPEAARDMERSVDALRARGVSFAMTVATLADYVIEAEGQIVGGRAILRLREVSGIKYDLAELTQRHRKQTEDAAAMRALIEAISAPVWYRNAGGKLVFVNQAYARAVEAKDGTEAIERGVELFDHGARSEILTAHETAKPYSGRLAAVVAGQRRILDVIAVPARRGSAGIAMDATEAERMRGELRRMVDAHRRTLDQLATGVAIFGSNQQLSFYNAAYRSLWDLDAESLDSGPTDSAVLERLRAARKLPDEQDFRQWKSVLHEAYRVLEPKE